MTRENEEKVRLWVEKFKAYLSLVIFSGFFIIVIMMFFFPIMGGNRELMYSCVGGMATANTVIMAYWFTKHHFNAPTDKIPPDPISLPSEFEKKTDL